MYRLLFEKKESAVWISHLDLMRLFQRAFKRAGLSLTHSHGFNPRPTVSVALPLSVGVESVCELLDFDLDGEIVECGEICDRINDVLVSGLRVLDVYPCKGKIKDLAFIHTNIFLEYDNGIPVDCITALEELLSRDTLMVPKKGKNGVQDQDIIPLIRRYSVCAVGENEIILDVVLCGQNPSLNPMQIVSAIDLYLPEMKPNFAKCKRLEIYDREMNVFR